MDNKIRFLEEEKKKEEALFTCMYLARTTKSVPWINSKISCSLLLPGAVGK